MSLTSYRAAPPRVNFRPWGGPAGPGSDLLFRALRRSTIGAEGFHGRVRDGIGCFAPRYGHQAMQALPRSDPGLGATGVAPEEASCACLRPGFAALLAILAAGCGAQAQSSD